MPQLKQPIPIYAHGQERQAILAALARVRAGRAEWVLVSGEPGIGKSTLLADLCVQLSRESVSLAAGTFLQDDSAAPFAVLVGLLSNLVHQCLTDPPAGVDALRQQLQATLGPNARLLVSLAPELVLLLGPQPQPAPLEPMELRNRLYLALRSFLTVVATTERPVVVVLDNLHWADVPSLETLRRLFAEGALDHLLVVGSYGDTGLTPGAPLPLMLGELQRNGLPVQTFALAPLPVPAVGQLLADELGLKSTAVAALAQLIHAKTHGNPLFVRQFVARLVEQQLLQQDAAMHEWRWELAAIATSPALVTVEPLLQERLALLTAATQHRLALAACMGAEFIPRTLAAVAEETQAATIAALEPALAARSSMPMRVSGALCTMRSGMWSWQAVGPSKWHSTIAPSGGSCWC